MTDLFSEPAYFIINPNGTVRYLCISSHPMGGRPNVEALLMGLDFVKKTLVKDPEFEDSLWGAN